MNRDNKAKALHHYLSNSHLIFAMRNGVALQNWESLTEEIQEEYRRIGESLAQDLVYGGEYELTLSSLDEGQIVYNGLLSYVSPVAHLANGWCHVLLLRSKYRDASNEEDVQKMVIVTQVPGSFLAIQREIEHIATFIMEFFKHPDYNHPQDERTITPDNTTFIEYIPYAALHDTSDITGTHRNDEGVVKDISIVRFQWEEEAKTTRTFKNYKASNPNWQDTSVSAVNAMIQTL